MKKEIINVAIALITIVAIIIFITLFFYLI